MTILACAAAALAAGLAIGFWLVARQASEQVDYLRKRLANYEGSAAPSQTRALAPVGAR